MAFAFDTLGYSKRLQAAGISRPQAEAHAEAAREFIMTEVVTKQDLALAVDNLKLAMDNLKLAMDNQTHRLTIRLGSLVAAGIAALAVLQTILQRLH